MLYHTWAKPMVTLFNQLNWALQFTQGPTAGELWQDQDSNSALPSFLSPVIAARLSLYFLIYAGCNLTQLNLPSENI